MKDLRIVNPVFNPSASTCSDLRPETFHWTLGESLFGSVYADASIVDGIRHNNDGIKFAWLIESPEILEHQGIVQYVRANRKLISHVYTILFTCIESLVGLEKNFVYCPSASNLPWIKNFGITKKSKMCSMFASRKRLTSGHKYREEIAKKFLGKIDLFGGTLESPNLGTGIHPDKSEGLMPYRFHIAIENCKVDKYYTEKITDCFATGTIPVYWGTDKISEDFNPDGIIKLDDNFDINSLTEELYQSKMSAIKENYEKVKMLPMADDCLMNKITKWYNR